MRIAKKIFFSRLTLSILLVLFLAACAGQLQLPARHQSEAELGQSTRNCSSCHEAGQNTLAWQRFNHGSDWGLNHRRQAAGQQQVCNMCHATSYCNDCHATRVELKPSDRLHGEPGRELPHRGDYQTRHRIDGRVDPGSCLRCHGNPRTAASCARCHG